jgi:hypothetical protein
LALLLAATAPGSAQSSDPSARTVKSNQVTAGRAARKPVKPAPRVTPPSAAQKPWTIENALPDHSASIRQYDTPQPKIGRVPLQSGPGTVGVETETKTNAYKTPDGRTIPGLDATAERSSSYMGLSLSVPTSDKSMPLMPLLPPWGRP